MASRRRIGGAGGGSDPGKGKPAGGLIVAAVLAGVVAAGGSLGVGGGGALSGTVLDGAMAGQGLSARTVKGKESARKGKADQAWGRMGLRALGRAVKRDLRCVASSTGRVRQFFVRVPCTSLDRVLFAVGDGHGSAAVISVAWVGFRFRSQAREFERIEKVHGSGDITPLAATLLGMADIRFTGHHYQSRRKGGTVVVAETEPAAGHVSDEVLDALADVAVLLPRP